MRHRKDAAAGRTLYRPDEIVHIVCRLKTGNVVFGRYFPDFPASPACRQNIFRRVVLRHIGLRLAGRFDEDGICADSHQGLLFCSFDLDVDADVFGHTGVNEVVHAPFGAVDGGAEVAAANFGFRHRALVAVEFFGFEFDGGGFAAHGQVAVNGNKFFAVEVEFGGNEADVRILSGIEDVGGFQVAGEGLRTALQVGDGNGDVDFAVAFCLIELDGTGQTVKTADVGAGVEVVDGETDVGVIFVHFVGGGGSADGCRCERGEDDFFS